MTASQNMRVNTHIWFCWPSPGQGKDVPCRIDVAMQRQTAAADMLALSQTFLHNLAAVAASLAGASGIHFHHHDASSFSLASQGCQKAAPCGIHNRTTESAVPQHPLDVEAFHSNQTVATAQLQSYLVTMFLPQILHANVPGTQNTNRFPAVLAALLFSGHSPSGTTQSRKLGFEVRGIRLLLPFRGGRETFDAYVDPDRRVGAGRNRHIAQVAGEDGIPFIGFPLERDGFDRAFNPPMPFDLHLSHMLNAKFFLESDGIPVGGKLRRETQSSRTGPRL